MSITNETILKAAKAAGLEFMKNHETKEPWLPWPINRAFLPLHNDGDNAMIRRGAEIDVSWCPSDYHTGIALATCFYPEGEIIADAQTRMPFDNDKGAAEREAVILCAAAKYDAMNGDVK